MPDFEEKDSGVVPALLRERAGRVIKGDTEGIAAIDEQLALRGYVKKDAKNTPPEGRSATPPNVSKGV